ncbi:MAG: L,D-transpeptidase family protein [Actinomycetes bacterium]
MRRYAAAMAVVAVSLSACGSSGGSHQVALPSATPSASAVPVPTPTPTFSPRARPTPVHKAAPHRVVRPPAARVTHHATVKPQPLLVTRLNGVGSARQVISVVASGYGTDVATLKAFEKSGSSWRRVYGPWTAHIGRDGFAPPGSKREGDLRTPSGSYGFSFMYGLHSDPGVRYSWRAVTGSYDVWDDDSSSARYNLWTDTRYDDAGRNPESMAQSPAYNYSAVIAYNTSRTPGMGSAIFLHVSTGGGTAGCVSLPTSELLDVLRWLDPAKGARIIMGTESTVT